MDLESVLTENEAKELIDLAPLRVCVIRGVYGGEHWWSDVLFGVLVFYSRYFEWKKHNFFWSNNWLLENFVKIYERRWRLYSMVGYQLHWKYTGVRKICLVDLKIAFTKSLK